MSGTTFIDLLLMEYLEVGRSGSSVRVVGTGLMSNTQNLLREALFLFISENFAKHKVC